MTAESLRNQDLDPSGVSLLVPRSAFLSPGTEQPGEMPGTDLLIAAVSLLWIRCLDLDQVVVGCNRYETTPDDSSSRWRLGDRSYHKLNRSANPAFRHLLRDFSTTAERIPEGSHRGPLPRLVMEAMGAVSEGFLWFDVLSRSSADLSLAGQPDFRHTPPLAAALSAQVLEHEDATELCIQFHGDHLGDAAGSRFVAHLQVLLRGIALDPGCAVDALPILGDEERNQVLVEWNAVCRVPGSAGGPSLLAGLAGQAARAPDSPALIENGSILTYRQLVERTNQWARALRRRGAGPGVTVATCLPRSTELVIALVALYKSGAAFVPLDPAHPPEQRTRQLTESGATLLITPPGQPAPQAGCTILELDTFQRDVADESPAALDIDVPGETLAAIFFTSGSTGEAKAVPSRRRDLWTGAGMALWYGLGTADRHVFKSALDSTLLGREINWPLATGGTLVIAPETVARDPAQLGRLLARERVTFMTLVPSHLRTLLEQPEFACCDSLKQICCFGEPLSSDLAERVRQRLSVSLTSFYGATEAPSVCLWHLHSDGTRPRGNLGFRLGHWKVYVLDRHRQPVPIGAVGELYVSGPSLTSGVLGATAEMRDRFLPNPFADDDRQTLYRTGDRVRWCGDGSLEFVGRIDDQVKIRGFRVEPAQVEKALETHPEIEECAVVARPNQYGENQLVAFFVYRSSCPTVGELLRHLADRVPRQYLPGAFIPLEQLPRNPTGKLDRRSLPADLSGRLRPASGSQAPRSRIEQTLHSLWRQILECDTLGIDDDFFELGGNSLHAMRLMGGIQSELGLQLPIEALYTAPTIRRLARRLADPAGLLSNALIVEIRPGGIRPPLFLFSSASGNTLHWQPLLKHLDSERPVLGLTYPRTPEGFPQGDCLSDLLEPVTAQILARQPTGPLYLAGYSAGVIPVYELAQQLQRAGRPVVFLGLIDSAVPGSWRWWHSVLDPRGFGRNLWSWIQHNNYGQSLKSLRKRLWSQLNIEPPPTGEMHAPRQISEVFRAIVRGYRPRLYPGPVTLFRSGVQTPWRYFRDDYGWNQYCPQLQSRVVSRCDHFDLLHEPHVASLGREMELVLQAAERAVPTC